MNVEEKTKKSIEKPKRSLQSLGILLLGGLVIGAASMSSYNTKNAVEKEVFNFCYKGMDAKVIVVEYPIINPHQNYILLEDGSKIWDGRLISDNGDTINIEQSNYLINGVKQK